MKRIIAILKRLFKRPEFQKPVGEYSFYRRPDNTFKPFKVPESITITRKTNENGSKTISIT